MWGDRQLDFPRGSGSQLGCRGLPLAVQPGARWWVMACEGSGADVPHCARAQKQAGLDFSALPRPDFCFYFLLVLSPSQLIPGALFIYLFHFMVGRAVKLLVMFSMRMPLPWPTRVCYRLCYFPFFILCLNVHVGCVVPCACTSPQNLFLDNLVT